MIEKFESQFRKIIGGTKEERAEVKEDLNRLPQEKLSEIASYEMPKSEKDKQIIADIESAVDDLIESYGGSPKPLPLERIRILKPGGVEKITGAKGSGASHYILQQFVIAERTPSDLDLALKLVHELLHLKSYKSAEITEEKVKPYRSGILIYETEKVRLLGELEEAIVAEATHQLYRKKIKNNPLYENEIAPTEKLKPWIRKLFIKNGKTDEEVSIILSELYSVPHSQEILKILKGDKSEEDKLDFLSTVLRVISEGNLSLKRERYEEREKFDKLLEEMLVKSGGRFKDKDEVFNEFAQATFSGNLSPLRRMIDDVLGKGSFRRIIKEFTK